MNAVEVVETFITALQSGETDEAATMMSPDFNSTGFGGTLFAKPLDKGEFLVLQSALYGAMPDMQYNLANLHAQNDQTVTGTIRLAGTQTNDLEVPFLLLPTIKAEQNTISLPETPVTFQLKHSLVALMNVRTEPGGGMDGLVQQLGGDLQPTQGEHLNYNPKGDPD